MKIESHDVVFLENDFPSIGEVNKVFQLYKIEDLNNYVIVGVIFYLFLHSWRKIMSHHNLKKAFMNQFLVVNLRLRGKRS
jgi:hypothetical protein